MNLNQTEFDDFSFAGLADKAWVDWLVRMNYPFDIDWMALGGTDDPPPCEPIDIARAWGRSGKRPGMSLEELTELVKREVDGWAVGRV